MNPDTYDIEHDGVTWWATCPDCGDTSDTCYFRDEVRQWADVHVCRLAPSPY
jgi:hypothetical protein